MAITVVQSKVIDDPASPAGSFDNPTTAGNCVVVFLVTFATSNVTISTSGVTLGGAGDNFAQASSVQTAFSAGLTGYAGCWVDPGCAGGQTAISATVNQGTWGSGDCGLFLLELSGVATTSPVDVSSSGSATSGTAASSGTTAGTSVAGEMAVGVVYPDIGPAGGLVTPSATYANLTMSTSPYTAAAGYLTLSSAGSTTSYTGTSQLGAAWAALVITLKP